MAKAIAILLIFCTQISLITKGQSFEINDQTFQFVEFNLKFSDFLGRKLEQKYLIAPRAKYKEFDISQIPSGFYFLHISNDFINEGI